MCAHLYVCSRGCDDDGRALNGNRSVCGFFFFSFLQTMLCDGTPCECFCPLLCFCVLEREREFKMARCGFTLSKTGGLGRQTAAPVKVEKKTEWKTRQGALAKLVTFHMTSPTNTKSHKQFSGPFFGRAIQRLVKMANRQ